MTGAHLKRLAALEKAMAPKDGDRRRVHLVAGEDAMSAEGKKAAMIAAGEGSPDDEWLLLVTGVRRASDA